MQSVLVAVAPASPPKCTFCAAELRDFSSQHVCEACGSPQPLAEGEDYFKAFSVRSQFAQDRQSLEKKFYQVSRLLHPDRFSTASAELKAFSLNRMSFLNEAYRTLKDPSLLRDYLLERNGFGTAGKSSSGMGNIPMELAEAWFEVQDVLAEDPLQAQGKLRNFEAELMTVERQVEQNIRALESAYDDAGSQGLSTQILEKIAKEVQKQSYLKSLQKDVERIKKNAYPN